MDIFQKYVTMIQQDIRNAMRKRNGLDELSNFIMLIGFIFVVTALFTKNWIFTLVGAAFIVLCYLRVFSSKKDKRKNENTIYMKYMGGVVRGVDYITLCIRMKIKTLQDKEHAFFVCSGCRQIIRVPKGKNKVSIRCPKCNKTFIKRT
ncbi:MAG: hypothetical protein K2I10_04655 [Lachnospiraceae bacterium]|nr:hypothetical protein [Lachnospiraceae bacterium]